MSVLILKNVPQEGPGTIEDFLRENGIYFRIIEMQSEEVPSAEGFDTLVIMGGPMSVNDTGQYPYITREIKLVKDFLAGDKKVFGVCLGAQIMAKALGANVYYGKGQEIGWYDIEIEDNGVSDRLIAGLAAHPVTGEMQRKLKVFHWHGETFDIPEGAVRLAGSELYPNQAFRYGSSSYGFQFHIEVRKEMVYEWMENEPLRPENIRKDTEAFFAEYAGRAKNFYRAFFGRPDA